MKKSVKVIGKKVQFAYVIKDIDVDKVTIEKYSVDCREDIEDAWTATSLPSSGQSVFSNCDDKIFEIVLLDKINNITMTAKPNVIETVAKLGGKVIKDFKVERVKRGKKAYISDIEFFKEPI